VTDRAQKPTQHPASLGGIAPSTLFSTLLGLCPAVSPVMMAPVRIPPLRQWRGAAAWTFVALLVVTEAVGHRFHLPHSGSWLDTYVYARGASGFIAHPGALYDAAATQLHSASAQNAFIYPPSALLPFLPMVPVTRMLGVAWTAEIWTWVDCVALLAALVLVARQLGIGAERTAWLLAGLMLTLPVLAEVDSGQIEGVILLLLVLSWRAWPRPSSGVLLGAALALKPVAPWLLLVPLAMRRPRVTVAAVATLLALNVPFLPFIGSSATGFYLLHFLPYIGTHVMRDVANMSVANLLQTWIGGVPMIPAEHASISPLHSLAAVDVVLLALRGVAVVLFVRELRLRRHAPLVLFAMALAAVPLLAPTAWAHYYVFVLPAVLVLLTARSAPVRRITGACVVAVMLLNCMLDATTFHLAMYPIDLVHDRSAANVLSVMQDSLLALASVAVVFAVGLMGPRLRMEPRPHDVPHAAAAVVA
jgi:alpha-1,2-mannosyltransferase